MIFRYRMLSSCTYANMKADITGILTGTITTTGGLSAGADTANSTVYGTYPSGIYSVSNSGTSTYAKIHNAYNTYTHYYRMGWDGSTSLTSVSLAQSYTSGTDTLVNSYSYSLPTALAVQSYQPIDIVVTNSCVFFSCPAYGINFGIFDIGHSGLTRAFTSSALMMLLPLTSDSIVGTIPYTYNLLLSPPAYGVGSTQSITYQLPNRIPYNSAGNLAVMENPPFTYSLISGNSINVVYGLNKIFDSLYAPRSVYSDGSGTYRYVVATPTYTFSITST